jgi:hypothetical protein
LFISFPEPAILDLTGITEECLQAADANIEMLAYETVLELNIILKLI